MTPQLDFTLDQFSDYVSDYVKRFNYPVKSITLPIPIYKILENKMIEYNEEVPGINTIYFRGYSSCDIQIVPAVPSDN